MTNKKFKIAAMSMALTACVAAQPLMANAADDVDSVKDAAPEDKQNTDDEQKEQAAVAAETVEVPSNKEEEDAQPAFKDEEVKYNPDSKVTEEDGSTTMTGTIEKKDDTEDKSDGEKTGESEGESDGEKTGESEGESDGEKTGESEGESDGEKTGESEGESDGEKTGESEGESDGEKGDESEGESDGEKTGESEGESDGEKTGESEGESDGEKTGESEGESDGEKTGESEGESDGEKTGESEGESDGDKADDTKKDETGDKADDTKKDETSEKADDEKKPESEVKADGTKKPAADDAEKKDDTFDGTAKKNEKDEKTETSPAKPNPGAEPIQDTTKDVTQVTDPDTGTTTITTPTVTPGTETTTTTGSGTAKGDTTEVKYPDEIDLDKELEGATIDWDVKAGATVGDTKYKVGKVEEEDGKQKLTLVKKEESEGSMTADDIAKLVDADKVENEDGSYTLTRTEEVKDEDGNTVTRTTYITVKDSHVKIESTTTLTVTREKQTHTQPDDNTVDVKNDFKLPDITVTDKENNKKETISADKLKELLKDKATTDGTYDCVDEDGRTYTIEVSSKAADDLSAEEIAARLGSDYKAENGKVYYVGNGQNAELTVEQTEGIRKLLSYTVTMTEKTKGETETIGKEDAETKAKTEAIKSALKNAVGKMKDVSEADAKELEDAINDAKVDLTDKGGTFIWTAKSGKTYTLVYAGATVTAGESKPSEDQTIPDDITDVKDNTVNGSSYVISGKVEWKKEDGKTGGGTYTSGGEFKPDGDGFGEPIIDTSVPGIIKKTYEREVKSADGKTVTKETYVVIEKDVTLTLSKEEKEALAWKALLEEHKEYKSIDELKKAGYNITDYDFSNVKQVDWTVSKTTVEKTTERETDFTEKTLVAKDNTNWDITENAKADGSTDTTFTITIDGKEYKNVTKIGENTYTCTRTETRKDANGKDITYNATYTFTATYDTMGDDEIRALLASQFGIAAEDIDKIELDKVNKTARYTSKKDGTTTTTTIKYDKLTKGKLDVKQDLHGSVNDTVTVKNDAEYKKYCEDLLQRIKDEILPTLDASKKEKLYLSGTDIEITSETHLTEEIMAYFTKAISPEDMTEDEIIAALKKQAEVAKTTDVIVNEGKKNHLSDNLQETLKNFYSGVSKKGDYYEKDGELIQLKKDKDGYYYGKGKNKTYVQNKDVIHLDHPDTIEHLDLASGSKLELLPTGDQTKDSNTGDKKTDDNLVDCVIISKNLKLEWNYSADDLVKPNAKNPNRQVGLQGTISQDTEDGKNYHFEYDRINNANNNPNRSAYYKLTGTVAYDAIKDGDKVKLFQDSDEGGRKVTGKEAAVNAYLAAIESSKTYKDLTETELNEIIGTYVVEIGKSANNQGGDVGYQVYKKTSELEAYGYMSRDANTCTNRTYRNQDEWWDREDGKPKYVGGYDLMISKLKQVREGKVIGYTDSTTMTVNAPWSIRSELSYNKSGLTASNKTTTTETTHTTENKEYDKGSQASGNYSYTYEYDRPDEEYDWKQADTKGTGTGYFISFAKWVESTFFGSANDLQKDEGSFTYSYEYTTETPLQAEDMVQETIKHADVSYDYTTVETRDVLIPGEDRVEIDPEDPTTPDDDTNDPVLPTTPELPPVQDATPDAPVLPTDVELPPVQDAKPDQAILPANPVLPPVQDARLPQTGVNWLAAIGMALSGVSLMAAGAFASLTGKNAKH